MIPSSPELFLDEKIVSAAEVNQRHCLEESGQWHENVDQTQLVLARGKLVLQTTIAKPPSRYSTPLVITEPAL